MASRCELCGDIWADRDMDCVEINVSCRVEGNHGELCFEAMTCKGCGDKVRALLREAIGEHDKIRIE